MDLERIQNEMIKNFDDMENKQNLVIFSREVDFQEEKDYLMMIKDQNEIGQSENEIYLIKRNFEKILFESGFK